MGSTEPQDQGTEKDKRPEEERLDAEAERKRIAKEAADKEAERLLKVEKETRELVDKIAIGLPDLAEHKPNKMMQTLYGAIAGILAVTFIYMIANVVLFFVLLGNQTLQSALMNFIVIMIFWNFMITIIMVFGLRDAWHNIKMFFLRRNGYGYDILFDRDRGIKRFVVKLNVKAYKIFGKIYFTNRKKLRLWENKIPTYVHEAGFLEPINIGGEKMESIIDSDEYQTTVELAEQAGTKKTSSTTKMIFFAVLIVGFIAIVGLAITYQFGTKLDLMTQYLQQVGARVANMTGG